MTEESSTARTIRLLQAQALRDAVKALEDVDPDDIREWLSDRADSIDGGQR